MMRLPNVQTKTEYTRVIGGLDMKTPALSMPPGRAILAMNYEAIDAGGLRRIDGYERYDGQTSPSSASYYYCEGTYTVASIALNDVVTGETSGASGIVVYINADDIALIVTSGTFSEDENILDSGSVIVGAFDGTPELNAAPLSCTHATIMNNAADYYRSLISAPPGSGPVRGGGVLDDVVYVFRDNEGATAADLWKSTASGWSQVTLFSEISFDTGVGTIEDGDVITQLVSGASALVRRAVLESGAWDTDAVGRLVISSISGTFDATNALQVGGVTQATSTSLATAITIATGGTYETVNYNFYGGSDTYRMYGCSGVDYGFEFDGTVYVPIHTGMTADTPNHIWCHQKRLFFAFDASLQMSSVGTPYSWTPLTGAAEIGMGDDINGIISFKGEVLGVIGSKGTYQLTGTTTDDFQLDVISPDSGGEPYTTRALVSTILTLGRFGVYRIDSSEQFGNFEQFSISRDVQVLINAMLDVVIGSAIYGSRNQYRLYGSDGTGICVTSSTERRGLDFVTVYYATQFKYPINLNVVFSSDNDEVFLCDDGGNVYQANKGSSFDGEEIEGYFQLMFNHSKSPTTLKSYTRAVMDVTSEGCSVIRFHPEFAYSNPRYAQHIIAESTLTGVGGRWGDPTPGMYYWDTQVIDSESFPLRGSGENISIVGYSKSDTDLGHKIDGVVFHYIPRRLNR